MRLNQLAFKRCLVIKEVDTTMLQERKRAAQLLSQLPPDIDIAMLLQPETPSSVPAAAAVKGKKGKKGIAPAPGNAIQSDKALDD